jgi:hypothetical protein
MMIEMEVCGGHNDRRCSLPGNAVFACCGFRLGLTGLQGKNSDNSILIRSGDWPFRCKGIATGRNAPSGAAFGPVETLVSKPFAHLQNFAMPDNLYELIASAGFQNINRAA